MRKDLVERMYHLDYEIQKTNGKMTFKDYETAFDRTYEDDQRRLNYTNTKALFLYICEYKVSQIEHVKFILDHEDIIKTLSNEELNSVFGALTNVGFFDALKVRKNAPTEFYLWSKLLFGHDWYVVNKVNHLDERILQKMEQDPELKSLWVAEARNVQREEAEAEKARKKEQILREAAEAKARAEREVAEQKRLEAKKQAEIKAAEARMRKIQALLKKTAQNINKGNLVNTWFVVIDGKQVKVEKTDIARLSRTDEAWREFFGAVVAAQDKVETREDLKQYKKLLDMVRHSGKVTNASTLIKKSVRAKMIQILGVSKEEMDVSHYGRDAKSIKRYREVRELMDDYWFLFDSSLPGSLRGVNVYDYDNELTRTRRVMAEVVYPDSDGYSKKPLKKAFNRARTKLAEAIDNDTDMKLKIERKMSSFLFPAKKTK